MCFEVLLTSGDVRSSFYAMRPAGLWFRCIIVSMTRRWMTASKTVIVWACGIASCKRSMVVSGSPNRWDRWHSPSPNWQYIPLIYHLYTTYNILPFGGLYATYHLLGEPETTIEKGPCGELQSLQCGVWQQWLLHPQSSAFQVALPPTIGCYLNPKSHGILPGKSPFCFHLLKLHPLLLRGFITSSRVFGPTKEKGRIPPMPKTVV